MNRYLDLLMGLITGVALLFLNTEMVKEAIIGLSTMFDVTNTNTVFFEIGTLLSRVCIILSFVGAILIIIFSILILKKTIIKK